MDGILANPVSARKRCDELGLADNVAGHRGFQLINVCAGLERQHLVQREELERIVVWPSARRRTRAFVPDQGEGGEDALRVILSLHRAVGKAWLFLWLALGQLRHTCGNV